MIKKIKNKKVFISCCDVKTKAETKQTFKELSLLCHAPPPDAASTILYRRDVTGQEMRSLGLLIGENLILHSGSPSRFYLQTLGEFSDVFY